MLSRRPAAQFGGQAVLFGGLAVPLEWPGWLAMPLEGTTAQLVASGTTQPRIARRTPAAAAQSEACRCRPHCARRSKRRWPTFGKATHRPNSLGWLPARPARGRGKLLARPTQPTQMGPKEVRAPTSSCTYCLATVVQPVLCRFVAWLSKTACLFGYGSRRASELPQLATHRTNCHKLRYAQRQSARHEESRSTLTYLNKGK